MHLVMNKWNATSRFSDLERDGRLYADQHNNSPEKKKGISEFVLYF